MAATSAEVERRFPDAPRPWIDLSTGINPVAYPVPPLSAESWARLPSRSDQQALLAAAADRYGVRDLETIVAAPGTQALIQLLPRLMPKMRVAVVGPTYEEHEVSWRRHGHDVTTVRDFRETDGADAVVVVNPDNPTGRLLTTSRPARAVRPCWSSTRLSSTSCRHRRALRAICRRARSSCDPSARPTGWPASGWASRLQNHTLRRDCARNWGRGQSRAGSRDRSTGTRTMSLGIGRQRRAGGRLHQARQTARRSRANRSRGHALVSADPSSRCARVGNEARATGIHVRAFTKEPEWLRWGLPGNDAAFDRLAAVLLDCRTV